jgi:hypothetical protein
MGIHSRVSFNAQLSAGPRQCAGARAWGRSFEYPLPRQGVTQPFVSYGPCAQSPGVGRRWLLILNQSGASADLVRP